MITLVYFVSFLRSFFTDELDDVGVVEVLHVGRLLQTLLDVT